MSEPTRARRIAERVLQVAVIGHAAITVLALAVLVFFGEKTRAGFFLLYLPRHPFALATIVLLPLALLARRRALVVLELATFLVATFPLMGLRVGRARAPQIGRQRLLTYNVFFGHLDRKALAAEIAATQPDFVVLQASLPAFNEWVRAALPDHLVHDDGEFLVAMNKQTKIVAVDDPDPIAGAHAGWFGWHLEGPHGPLRLIAVHPRSARAPLLDHADVATDVAIRESQWKSALDAAAAATEPVIVAGDTNLATLSAIERTRLGSYHDAFAEVGAGFGYTFPAKLPWMRLDRVLGSSRIRFLDVRVLPRGASDHRGLVADFEIEPR